MGHGLEVIVVRRDRGVSVLMRALMYAGEKATSSVTWETYDYSSRDDVAYSEILLPEHAPKEYSIRSVLWDSVERAEGYINSRLAYEVVLKPPFDATAEPNIRYIREFIKSIFVDRGMCADLCIHKDEGFGHAHVLLSTRPINEDGSWGMKAKREYILDNQGERVPTKSGDWMFRKTSLVKWDATTKTKELQKAWDCFVADVLKHE